MMELAVAFRNFADTPKDVMKQAASFDMSGEFHVCSLCVSLYRGYENFRGERDLPVFAGWFAGSSANIILKKSV